MPLDPLAKRKVRVTTVAGGVCAWRGAEVVAAEISVVALMTSRWKGNRMVIDKDYRKEISFRYVLQAVKRRPKPDYRAGAQDRFENSLSRRFL
jgi:hypothetical protein